MTAGVSTAHFRSWSELLDYLNTGVTSGFEGQPIENYWFRGQSSSEFRLIASLDRSLANRSAATRNKVQTRMIATFRERTANLDNVEGLEENQILAVLQHYGAPTRLLDWTLSPFIGAFFAFAGDQAKVRTISENGLAAVWALRHVDECLGDQLGAQTFAPFARGNLRVGAQRGRFTRTTADVDSLEEHVDRYYRAKPPAFPVLYQLTIPQSEASNALKALEHMGISSESMFPGLEGESRYAFFKALDLEDLLD